MNRKFLGIISGATLLIATSARAGIVLDFEGLADGQAIGDTYQDSGLSFATGVAIVDKDFKGGSGKFGNNPSGITVAGWGGSDRDSNALTINSSAGMVDSFGLFYSSTKSATVNVWSDVDGGGSLLATIKLTKNGNGKHLVWDEILLPFDGVAHSIQFVGKGGSKTYIDNALVNFSVVPVPGALGLSLVGLAFAAFLRRSLA